MQLRQTITRPLRYEDDQEREELQRDSSDVPTAPPPIPRHVRPVFPAPYTDYNANHGPAAFPTLLWPVPPQQPNVHQVPAEEAQVTGHRQDLDVVVVGSSSEDESDHDESSEESGEPLEPVRVSNTGEIIDKSSEDEEPGQEPAEKGEGSSAPDENHERDSTTSEETRGRVTIQTMERTALQALPNVAQAIQNAALTITTNTRAVEMRAGATQNATERLPSPTHRAIDPRSRSPGTWTRQPLPEVEVMADIDPNSMFPIVPVPEQHRIQWRDIKTSLRIEVIANAVAEGIDFIPFCNALGIDNQYLVHACLCLQGRTLQLEKEDLVTAEAIGQQNRAIQMPERIVDVQYYHRYGRYPSKEERLTYMSDQAHGRTLKGVGDSILNDHRNIAWADLDRMFHCKRGDLRLAQEFLRERRQDPRLAGLHWEGGDTTAFEAGETAAMEAGDQRRRLPTVSSSSSEEGIVEQSQTVTLGLPTMRQGLGEIQGGLRAVRTPYELPDRYAAYIGARNPPQNLSVRPRGFSPPRWHRSQRRERMTRKHSRSAVSSGTESDDPSQGRSRGRPNKDEQGPGNLPSGSAGQTSGSGSMPQMTTANTNTLSTAPAGPNSQIFNNLVVPDLPPRGSDGRFQGRRTSLGVPSVIRVGEAEPSEAEAASSLLAKFSETPSAGTTEPLDFQRIAQLSDEEYWVFPRPYWSAQPPVFPPLRSPSAPSAESLSPQTPSPAVLTVTKPTTPASAASTEAQFTTPRTGITPSKVPEGESSAAGVDELTASTSEVIQKPASPSPNVAPNPFQPLGEPVGAEPRRLRLSNPRLESEDPISGRVTRAASRTASASSFVPTGENKRRKVSGKKAAPTTPAVEKTTAAQLSRTTRPVSSAKAAPKPTTRNTMTRSIAKTPSANTRSVSGSTTDQTPKRGWGGHRIAGTVSGASNKKETKK